MANIESTTITLTPPTPVGGDYSNSQIQQISAGTLYFYNLGGTPRIGFSTFEDSSWTFTYQPDIPETSVVEGFFVNFEATLSGASGDVRIMVRKLADGDAIMGTANAVTWAPYAGGWPDVETGLREMAVTLVNGANSVNIAVLLADLLGDTAWVSGNRVSVGIRLATADLNGSNFIDIDGSTLETTVTYSASGREQQFADLDNIIPMSFYPFDAEDMTGGNEDFLRSVVERRDSALIFPRANVSTSVVGLQVVDIEYDPLIPSTGRMIPFEGTGSFTESLGGGPNDLIHPNNARGGEIGNAENLQWEPTEQSIILMSSWYYDAGQGFQDDIRHFLDTTAALACQNWITCDLVTSDFKIVTDATGGTGTGDIETVSFTPLIDGDIVEMLYFFNFVTAETNGQLRVRHPNGSIDTYEVPTITVDTTRASVPVTSFQLPGYWYQDQPTHGIINSYSSNPTLTWDGIKEAADWAMPQWQSGYKVLPYQWRAIVADLTQGPAGAVYDTTAVATTGGLSSSVIGVCRNEAQAAGQFAGRGPDRLSTPVQIHRIGLPVEDSLQSVNIKGKGMLYVIAESDTAFGAAFTGAGAGYRNATNPPVTVLTGQGCWAVEI